MPRGLDSAASARAETTIIAANKASEPP